MYHELKINIQLIFFCFYVSMFLRRFESGLTKYSLGCSHCILNGFLSTTKHPLSCALADQSIHGLVSVDSTYDHINICRCPERRVNEDLIYPLDKVVCTCICIQNNFLFIFFKHFIVKPHPLQSDHSMYAIHVYII